MTVAEVAEHLRVSRWFVYDHPDELGLVKVGGANRYRREAVEAFVERPMIAAGRRQESPRKSGRRVPLLDSATPLRPEKRV